MIRKLSREHSVGVNDMRAVLAAGVLRDPIENALAVCFAFNTMSHLADAFGASLPDRSAFDAGAKYLLARGYR